MTGVPLGAAEGLLATISDAAQVRPLVGTVFARPADSQVVARDIGEAAIKIESARLLIEDATSALDRAALDRRTLSERERARNTAQAQYDMQLLGEAVQLVRMETGRASVWVRRGKEEVN